LLRYENHVLLGFALQSFYPAPKSHGTPLTPDTGEPS
jgi:hypothetical protein